MHGLIGKKSASETKKSALFPEGKGQKRKKHSEGKARIYRLSARKKMATVPGPEWAPTMGLMGI